MDRNELKLSIINYQLFLLFSYQLLKGTFLRFRFFYPVFLIFFLKKWFKWNTTSEKPRFEMENFSQPLSFSNLLSKYISNENVPLSNNYNITIFHCTTAIFGTVQALAQLFSCEFCDIFKNTYFIEHHRTTASHINHQRVFSDSIFDVLLVFVCHK